MANRKKHWTQMTADELAAAQRESSRQDGLEVLADPLAVFAEENAKVAKSPEYRRLMAIPDDKVFETDAAFYAAAGVTPGLEWQGHIVEDDREVVLGRVARQIVDKYLEEAIAARVSVAAVMAGLTVSPELQPYLEKELSIYNEVAFTPVHDSLASSLEGELNYNHLVER